MNIEWSVEALADLSSLHAFIAKDNPNAAQKVAMTIVASVETNLPDNPHIGRQGRVNGTRELVITHTPYIVPYRINQTPYKCCAFIMAQDAGRIDCNFR